MSDKRRKIERKRDIDLVLTQMFAYFQTEVYEPSVLDIYHQALEGYRIEDIRAACTAHIKSSKWFPKVSEIIELIPKPHVPQLESTATLQAHHILEMVRIVGYRNPPTWDDPITAILMRTRWSWGAVCELLEDQNVWFVKEFTAAYSAMVDQRQAGVGMLDAPEKLKQIAAGLFKGVGDDS
jgi:hypothetical protein